MNDSYSYRGKDRGTQRKGFSLKSLRIKRTRNLEHPSIPPPHYVCQAFILTARIILTTFTLISHGSCLLRLLGVVSSASWIMSSLFTEDASPRDVTARECGGGAQSGAAQRMKCRQTERTADRSGSHRSAFLRSHTHRSPVSRRLRSLCPRQSDPQRQTEKLCVLTLFWSRGRRLCRSRERKQRLSESRVSTEWREQLPCVRPSRSAVHSAARTTPLVETLRSRKRPSHIDPLWLISHKGVNCKQTSCLGSWISGL